MRGIIAVDLGGGGDDEPTSVNHKGGGGQGHPWLCVTLKMVRRVLLGNTVDGYIF